jgi:hypothetical protein
MSAWIQHIKDTQAKHGVSYKEAMSMAKETYHKGSASKTRPGHEDFMAHKGSKSKTRPGHEDYMAHKGTKSKTHRGYDYEGGAVGDIPIVPSSIPSFGNTNMGVMRVPQSRSRVVNGPTLKGRGVIDELGNQNYIGQVYNQTDLGANGVVRL